MMEIFVFYVLPNAALFGSLWLAARLFERATWHSIVNYEKYAADKNFNKIFALWNRK
jgi:hypothetical protein